MTLRFGSHTEDAPEREALMRRMYAASPLRYSQGVATPYEAANSHHKALLRAYAQAALDYMQEREAEDCGGGFEVGGSFTLPKGAVIPPPPARERSEHLSPPSSEREGSRDALLDAEGSAEGGGEDDLRKAGAVMLADYQTSERHHPDYVLVSLAAFEAMRVALAKVETEGL